MWSVRSSRVWVHRRKRWLARNGNVEQLEAELRANPQIDYHLWSGICAVKITVKTGRGGQKDDPAAHSSLIEETQQVLTREDGGAVLTAIW